MMWKWLRTGPKRSSPPDPQPESLAIDAPAKKLSPGVIAEISDALREEPRLSNSWRDILPIAATTVAEGGALSKLKAALENIGWSDREAGELALDLQRRAAALEDIERRISLGIETAEWLHSGSPCGGPNSHPNLDAQHRAAHGKRYKVQDGMLLGGHQTWPGKERGCKCISRSILPELEQRRQ